MNPARTATEDDRTTNTAPQIVALALVRDEDLFLGRALANVLAFADRVLVCDNGSRDRSVAIVEALAARHPRVELRRVAHPRESHELIRPLAGGRVWVLGVDGDELYDPAGLAVMRERIRAGVYDRCYRVYGNMLNCVALDRAAGAASGHLAPPCRSTTKLYNFAALADWKGPCPQRLHGGTVVFNPGFGEGSVVRLHEELAWDASPFRCLHAVFLPRSSLQPPGVVARPNVTETYRRGLRPLLRRLAGRLRGAPPASAWKLAKYRRGPVVSVDARPFFPPPEEETP